MTHRLMKVLSENAELHNVARLGEAMPEVVRPASFTLVARPMMRGTSGANRHVMMRNGATHRRPLDPAKLTQDVP